MNLENAGINLQNRLIGVDKFCKTNVDNIYAIGDVIEGPWLAHKASHDGVIVAEKIAGPSPKVLDLNKIPACVYSNLNSCIGLGEKEAKEKYKDI